MKSNDNSTKQNHNSTLIMAMIITCTLILTGGAPVSNFVFMALERTYDVKFESYNINHNIKYLKEMKKSMELEDSLKVEVNDIESLLSILESKDIRIIRIPTANIKSLRYRIDGEDNIKDYFKVLNNLKIGSIVIENHLFSEREMLIDIK